VLLTLTPRFKVLRTLVISQTLLEVLKTEKKRKEELLKLHSYDDVAGLRQQQKDAQHLLDTKRNLTAWTLLLDDEEEDME